MSVLAVARCKGGRLQVVAGKGRFLKGHGVYRISCVETGMVYYGSSSQKRGIRARWWKHISELNRDVHHSWTLQRDWNRHGEQGFIFEIIESCDTPEDCIAKEQAYLDAYGIGEANNSYNIHGSANCHLAKDQSEYRQRFLEACAKDYVVTSPSGEVRLVSNLSAFCEEIGISKENLHAVVTGSVRHCKGWRAEEASPESIKRVGKKESPFIFNPRPIGYVLTSPDGREIEVDDLPAFCRENNLKAKAMRQLCSPTSTNFGGKHRGWSCEAIRASEYEYEGYPASARERLSALFKGKTLSDSHRQKIGTANAIRIYKVISPHGVECEVKNLTAWCRKHNLNPSLMVMVAKGSRRHHKGWKCEYLD